MKIWILIKNSLKFVPKGPINNIPALVQIMAWCRHWWLDYWCRYASLGLNELTEFTMWYWCQSTQIYTCMSVLQWVPSLIARFMRPTWGPSGADRSQVGPILAPWTSLSGLLTNTENHIVMKWTHIPHYCTFVWGNHQSLADSHHKELVIQRSGYFFLISLY